MEALKQLVHSTCQHFYNRPKNAERSDSQAKSSDPCYKIYPSWFFRIKEENHVIVKNLAASDDICETY